jgi:hypothetical protein
MILMILPTWLTRGIFSSSWPLDARIQYQVKGRELTPTEAPWKRAKLTRFRFGQSRLACFPSNIIRAG